MVNSSALVAAGDEFLQRLAGIGQILNWKPLLADQASPQPDEASRMAGKPDCPGCMGELRLVWGQPNYEQFFRGKWVTLFCSE
jgi:hypothetical protein